jgi:hypothetical protein
MVLWLTLLAPAADQPAKADPPAKMELFAKEDWYKGQAGKEETFTGTLEKLDRGKNVVGFGRFNPYRLTMTDSAGKKTVREVYVGGKTDLLDPYVGKKVKLTGKAVDMEVEGSQHHEIWPARLEVVAGGASKEEKPDKAPAPDKKPEGGKDDKGEAGKEVKVLARGFWRAPVKGGEQQQLVIRSEEELVKAAGEKDAAATLARAFKVDGIDFKKQMVVVVTGGVQRTGGYSVEVTGIDLKDKTLTVHWKLNTPKPGSFVTQALTHPAQAVLVERSEAEVKFDPPAKKGDEKKPEK